MGFRNDGAEELTYNSAAYAVENILKKVFSNLQTMAPNNTVFQEELGISTGSRIGDMIDNSNFRFTTFITYGETT